MSNKEIIDKAKIIVLPPSYKDERHVTYNFTDFLESRDYIYLNADIIKDCYVHCNYNEHHFTTAWHYSNMLPAINKLFDFGYKRSDFIKIQNIFDEGDFSFLIPKSQTMYNAYSYITKVGEDDKKIQLIRNEYDALTATELTSCGHCNDALSYNTGLDTPYHRLYKFAHSSSVVNNMGKNNGKTILVSGDSHCIPILPILCYYYKTVIFCDNRISSFNMFKFLKMDQYDIDDVLFVIWPGNSIDKYIKHNLDIEEV